MVKKTVSMMMVVGLLLVGSITATAETYKLGLMASAGWTQYRVADVKGFWKKHGVDIEIADYIWTSDSARAGSQRRFDLTPMPLAFLVSFQEGGAFDAVYLGSFAVANFHKYLVIKNELVDKPLTGQTIGNFLPSPANNYLLAEYLNSVNTNLADVRQVPMTPDGLEANFNQGRLKAVLTLDLGNFFYERADGIVALSTEDFYEPYGLGIIREGGRSSIPPEDLKNILRGIIDAILWLNDPANWEEYKAILVQYCLPPGAPEMTDEQLRRFAQNHRFFDLKTMLEHNQQRLRDYHADYRQFLGGNHSIEEDIFNAFTYENAVYNQPLLEVLQEYIE